MRNQGHCITAIAFNQACCCRFEMKPQFKWVMEIIPFFSVDFHLPGILPSKMFIIYLVPAERETPGSVNYSFKFDFCVTTWNSNCTFLMPGSFSKAVGKISPFNLCASGRKMFSVLPSGKLEQYVRIRLTNECCVFPLSVMERSPIHYELAEFRFHHTPPCGNTPDARNKFQNQANCFKLFHRFANCYSKICFDGIFGGKIEFSGLKTDRFRCIVFGFHLMKESIASTDINFGGKKW